MENGGPILAMTVAENAATPTSLIVPTPNAVHQAEHRVYPYFKKMKPMSTFLDGEAPPPTIPNVDFSAATPTSVLTIEVPPYRDPNTYQPAYPPYTVWIHPDGSKDISGNFDDWSTLLSWGCYNTTVVSVNGNPLVAMGSMPWDVVSTGTRDFVLTSANDCVYEVFLDGTRNALACGIEGPSAMTLNGNQLMVTTLPGFDKNTYDVPVQAVKLLSIDIDTSAVTEVASMPIPADYEKDHYYCYAFPFTTYKLPTTIRNPVAVLSDGSFMVADTGASRIYHVASDGSTVNEYSTVWIFVAGLTAAPNDVLYAVYPPIIGDKLDGQGFKVGLNPALAAWDEVSSLWVTVTEIPGYTTLNAGSIGAGNLRIDCPATMTSQGYQECYVPVGLYMKLVPGENAGTPYLIISDPNTARVFQVEFSYP